MCLIQICHEHFRHRRNEFHFPEQFPLRGLKLSAECFRYHAFSSPDEMRKSAGEHPDLNFPQSIPSFHVVLLESRFLPEWAGVSIQTKLQFRSSNITKFPKQQQVSLRKSFYKIFRWKPLGQHLPHPCCWKILYVLPEEYSLLWPQPDEHQNPGRLVRYQPRIPEK